MKKYQVVVVIVVVCLAANCARVRTSEREPSEDRIAWIENNLRSALEKKHGAKPHTIAEEMARANVPGVSVAVIENYKIAWAKGYGVREAGEPDPVTAETLFQAASISKPFAALAALRLVRDGNLNLDTDVNGALQSWKLPKSDLGPVTLRQLLSHRAGLNVSGFPGYSAAAPAPSVIQVLNGEPPANTPAVRIEKKPGAQFQYSGGGYTIVQLLLTDIDPKPFPALMRSLVLEPLGMKHSTFDHPLPAPLSDSTATAHLNGKPVEGRYHVYPEMAAAGLWTTPSDLALAAIALQHTKSGKASPVLDQAGINEMWTKQGDGPCGLGFFLSGEGDASRFEHNGGNEGFTCLLVAYQDKGYGAAIMTNSSTGPRLYEKLLRAIADAYDWPEFSE
ncbi:MAG: serine hydrolase domain-containing protein [Candidatus Hydrogenedentes bacterium]|nr:serine hydrolase domain-containing protein [Candidatus Hydrogenedentota bacterium]